MKNRIILLLLIAVTTVGSLLAQHGHRMPARELSDEMKTELEINSEQAANLDKLHQETKEAMAALHERTDLDREGKRDAARTIHQSAKDRISEILTADQLASLKELRAAEKAERRELMESVDRKAMREEIQEYRKTEIAPVMRAQRLKLEEDLSQDNKASLTEIRATLKTAREAAKAQHREHKATQRQEGKERDGRRHAKRGHQRPHRGQKLHRLEENHPSEFAALVAMVEEYDTEITNLLEEIKPQQEEWKAAQKAIKERYIPADLHREHPSRPHHKQEDGERAERVVLAHKIHFLLKDPNKEEDQTTTDDAPTLERIAASTYPNPTTNTTILTFELPEAATMQIDLRDADGNLVRNVAREQFNAGQNKLAVDVADLQNGTYYFTLNSHSLKIAQSVKLVIVK
jgi:hypothetical protein